MISPLTRRLVLGGGKSASQLKLSRRMATTSSGLLEIGHKHVTKGVGRIVDGVALKGEGSYLHFEDGRHMLDFTCGIGVTNLGESLYSELIK
jgi:4-aminobutyrate aminotransferase-like enzyme